MLRLANENAGMSFYVVGSTAVAQVPTQPSSAKMGCEKLANSKNRIKLVIRFMMLNS
jgi:hypothetical protein